MQIYILFSFLPLIVFDNSEIAKCFTPFLECHSTPLWNGLFTYSTVMMAKKNGKEMMLVVLRNGDWLTLVLVSIYSVSLRNIGFSVVVVVVLLLALVTLLVLISCVTFWSVGSCPGFWKVYRVSGNNSGPRSSGKPRVLDQGLFWWRAARFGSLTAIINHFYSLLKLTRNLRRKRILLVFLFKSKGV